MYALTEKQIEFIGEDIAAQGISMPDLQNDLLDHICCVIEHNLEPDGDFEAFYTSQIKTFYKRDLKEIEEETITLLTLKNYYVMKKIMLLSGALLTGLLVIGLFLKFLHLPGAAFTLFGGMITLSLVFLPLFFTLKIKEKKQLKDKVVIAIATFDTLLLSVGVFFKVMHWPGANVMCVAALVLLLVVFLPVYFFTGIRNPDTKVNTVVTSVFILYGACLLLILIRSPKKTQDVYAANTEAVLRSEQILFQQQKIADKLVATGVATDDLAGKEILELCEKLKQFLVKCDTGSAKLSPGSENYISENRVAEYFNDAPAAGADMAKAEVAITSYNASLPQGLQRLESLNGIVERQVPQALNDLIQAQIIVTQNRAALVLQK